MCIVTPFLLKLDTKPMVIGYLTKNCTLDLRPLFIPCIGLKRLRFYIVLYKIVTTSLYYYLVCQSHSNMLNGYIVMTSTSLLPRWRVLTLSFQE